MAPVQDLIHVGERLSELRKDLKDDDMALEAGLACKIWVEFLALDLASLGLAPDRIRADSGGQAQLHEQRRRGFLWCLGCC